LKSTLLGIGTTAIILSFGIQAFAEGEHSRFAVGFHLSSLRLDGIGEQAVGASARCTGSLSNHLGLEAVVDHFPENASGNFARLDCSSEFWLEDSLLILASLRKRVPDSSILAVTSSRRG